VGTVLTAISPLLAYLLPLVGKILLTWSIIPNKIIPYILGAFNIVHKYWVLLGFPTAVATLMGRGDHFALIGGLGFLGSLLPVAWGVAESYLFHGHYEWRKAAARAAGTTSWWEKGKADLWQKK
jgi:hypothetical protein